MIAEKGQFLLISQPGKCVGEVDHVTAAVAKVSQQSLFLVRETSLKLHSIQQRAEKPAYLDAAA